MAKRGSPGEGSVYKDADKWVAAILVGYTPQGKPIKRKERFDTRKEAEVARRRMLREIESGMIITGRQTMKEFLERWLTEVATRRNKERTHEGYRKIVDSYLIPHLGKISLDKLTPLQVQKMINDLETQGLAPNTIRNIRAVLRRALNQAMTWGFVSRNVAKLVETPKIVQAEAVALTLAQAQVLIRACKQDRFGLVYRVALSLGLRRGEVLGLRWEDIDLDAATLRVTQTVQRTKTRGLIITTPKTKTSTRLLSIPAFLVAMLKKYKKDRTGGLVFTDEDGAPLEPDTITYAFKALAKRVGLPDTIHFHSLRHSCATFLLAQGVSPRTVMEVLGHSTISITLNIYAHVMPESLKEAADTMSDLFPEEEDQQEENEES